MIYTIIYPIAHKKYTCQKALELAQDIAKRAYNKRRSDPAIISVSDNNERVLRALQMTDYRNSTADGQLLIFVIGVPFLDTSENMFKMSTIMSNNHGMFDDLYRDICVSTSKNEFDVFFCNIYNINKVIGLPRMVIGPSPFFDGTFEETEMPIQDEPQKISVWLKCDNDPDSINNIEQLRMTVEASTGRLKTSHEFKSNPKDTVKDWEKELKNIHYPLLSIDAHSKEIKTYRTAEEAAAGLFWRSTPRYHVIYLAEKANVQALQYGAWPDSGN